MSSKPGPIRAYLKELRDGRSPVDASRIEAFGMPTDVVLDPVSELGNAEAFLQIMKDCLKKLDLSKQILIQHYLFTKGTSAVRVKAAICDLQKHEISTSDSYYKNNLRMALDSYADVIAQELAERRGNTHNSPPSPPLTPNWFDVIEIEWSLRLDRDNYRRQHWEHGIKILSRTGDQPLITLPQKWSGKGHRDGDVVILSGPPQGDPHSHQCLRIRPEQQETNSWDLYIFDLGKPLLPGKVESLRFAEILVDDEDCFVPYIWQSSARYPMLERILFVVDIPPELGVEELEAYREAPAIGSGIGFAPVSPMTKVCRDSNGLFRHTVTDIDHQSRYRLTWSAQYRK
jgi:hypothetical protein